MCCRQGCKMLMVRVLLIQAAGCVQERCLQPLALGSPVLEPKLNIFGFKTRELLSVGHAVQLIGVFLNELLRGVGVQHEPLLQAGHLTHRIYERPVPLASLIRHGHVHVLRRRGTVVPGQVESWVQLVHVHDVVVEHGSVGNHGKPRVQRSAWQDVLQLFQIRGARTAKVGSLLFFRVSVDLVRCILHVKVIRFIVFKVR